MQLPITRLLHATLVILMAYSSPSMSKVRLLCFGVLMRSTRRACFAAQQNIPESVACVQMLH